MENFIITNNAKELQAKMVAGSATAKFTHIVTSDHDYSEVGLETLTELTDIRQTAPVSSVIRKDAVLVVITASIDNSSLTDSYYVRTLGLYAEDDEGNEILFAVSTSGEYPDYMPPFSGGTVSAITYDMNIKVDTADQIIIEVNQAAAPTIKEVKEIAKREISTHAIGTVYGENGVHGLRCQNGKFEALDGEGNWNTILGSGQITDAVTGEVYVLGISNGVLTITGAEESGGNQNTNKIETINVVSGVLSAGETVLTLEDECITEDSTIDIYTNCYGVSPNTVEVIEGSITMTFKARVDDLQIKVVVK